MSCPHYSTSNPVSERNGYYFYCTDEEVESPERRSYLPEVTQQEMVAVRSNPDSVGSPLVRAACQPPLQAQVGRRGSAWPAEGGVPLKVSLLSLLGTASYHYRLIPKDLALVPGPGGAWGAWRGVQRNTKHSPPVK